MSYRVKDRESKFIAERERKRERERERERESEFEKHYETKYID